MSKTIVLHCPLNLFFFSTDSWIPFRDTFVAAPISTKACSRWLFLSISHFFLILSVIGMVYFSCLKMRHISLLNIFSGSENMNDNIGAAVWNIARYIQLKYSHDKCKKHQLWRNQGIGAVWTPIWFVTWLLQFTKTYAILHNLFKRIPYFEGSFIQQLTCLQPIQLHKIYGVKPNHIALKSETLCIKSPKPAPSKHFQFLPKILAWYCICHSCSNHSNLEIEAECLTKTIHTWI